MNAPVHPFALAMGKLRADVAKRTDPHHVRDEQGRWMCCWCRDFKDDGEFEPNGSLVCLDCARRERENA